jgi:DNA-binding SARP family transcriptional activator/tetratricopeptide (TPR) repeat protein
MVEFRLLGPLELIADDGRLIELPAGQPRALLALLLLETGRVVSVDRLLAALWGDEVPATAAKVVQGYVWRLRKLLPEGLLETREPGYVLRLEDDQLDLYRFERMRREAGVAAAGGRWQAAAEQLTSALALWRGAPLADVADQLRLPGELAALDELRLVTLEERLAAELALGGSGELVAELEALVSQHPLRERLHGQLMTALYRSGRQAEALAAYQVARSTLVDELGLEPGRELRELEQAILRQDPTLDRARDGPAHARVEPRRGAFFVGRERELGTLLGALEDALSGRGRLVLVGGEPGIGKSRLAEELAARAPEKGAAVLWGRCVEAGGAPPYWPWVQALRSYFRDRARDELRAELGPGASEIATVVPDLGLLLPDLAPAATLTDPQQARFRLFDSLAGFWKNASRFRPLVVVLEDLHSADEGTLLLLEHVTRELAEMWLLVIGTYRDIELSRGHPLSKTLAELAREPPFERFLLRGLSLAEVELFIEGAGGFSPEQAFVRAVQARTEGNPFFVSELMRLLSEEGTLSVRIPEGVRETIGRRLGRLSPDCNEALTIASVIGREFALVQLDRLVDDLSDDRLLDALDEALAAHVIEELEDPGRYQFTHALIQATLADELSLMRRARLHARIAAVLEELYGSRAEANAAELAHHFAEAEPVLGADKLVHYSLLAGETALAAHVPEQALAHFQRGLDAKGDATTDDETAVLLFGLGRAQVATLEPHELGLAVASLRRAFDHYAATGNVSEAAAVAGYQLPLAVGTGLTGAPELIARALTLVPANSDDEGRLLAQHGWFVGVVDADHEGAEHAFGRALAIARRRNDLALERRTLANAAFMDAFHLRWPECLDRGLRAVRLAEDAGDAHNEMTARRAVAWALTATGQLDEGRRHAEAALALAEKLRWAWWLASTSFTRALLALYEGDWTTAREMGDLGLAAQPRDPRHFGVRLVLEYEQGNDEEGRVYGERLHEAAQGAPPGPIADNVFFASLIPLAGRIAGIDPGLDAAAVAAEQILSAPRVNPGLAMVATIGHGLIAVERRDRDTAAAAYAKLDRQRGTGVYIIPLAIDRILGLLAANCGRLDDAAGHFEHALAFCARAGYRPQYAWTAADYAEMLLATGVGLDRPKASTLHQEALTIAKELRMRPLAARIIALRA